MLNINTTLQPNLTSSGPLKTASLDTAKLGNLSFDDYLVKQADRLKQTADVTAAPETSAAEKVFSRAIEQVNALREANLEKVNDAVSEAGETQAATSQLDTQSSAEQQQQTIEDYLQALRDGGTLDAEDDEAKDALKAEVEVSNPRDQLQSTIELTALISQMQNYRF